MPDNKGCEIALRFDKIGFLWQCRIAFSKSDRLIRTCKLSFSFLKT
jgi:hypothetical protein